MSQTGRQISKVHGMAYAPTCEQGVVALFGRLAPTLGFCIESVQTRFPDCTAKYRGKTCTVEFEFWASHYRLHRHPRRAPRCADYIVCWENDWETRPGYQHIEIIDLKKYTGSLPRVFAVGCIPDNADALDRARTEWNVPVTAQVGDLLVMYRVKFGEIRDLWKIVGEFRVYGKRNKNRRKPGLQAGIKRVTSLARPLTFEALKNDPVTRGLPIMGKRFMGKTDITDYWPLLCRKILSLNPRAKGRLEKWTSAVT